MPYTEDQIHKITQRAYDTEWDNLTNHASFYRFHELSTKDQAQQVSFVRNALNAAAYLYPPKMTAEEFIGKAREICEANTKSCENCPAYIPKGGSIRACGIDFTVNDLFATAEIVAAVEAAKVEEKGGDTNGI